VGVVRQNTPSPTRHVRLCWGSNSTGSGRWVYPRLHRAIDPSKHGIDLKIWVRTCWPPTPESQTTPAQSKAHHSMAQQNRHGSTAQHSTHPNPPPTSHSVLQVVSSGHSTWPPAAPWALTAAAGSAAGCMLKAARCDTLSRGPYSPPMSTRLATLVRSRLAEKVCRQQRPLCSNAGGGGHSGGKRGDERWRVTRGYVRID
jgi:hypothetical protein